MSTRREQAIGAALFILLVLLGWTPFFWETVQAGIYDAMPVMLGGFFAIIAAGMTYDTAERMFGDGKGIYAAAILTSLPAAGIVFSEPPLLANASLMFITSATCWFASRARAENPRETLFFIVVLGAIPLAIFGFWPPAFIPLAALLLVRDKLNVPWTTILITGALGLTGLLAKYVMRLDLPNIMNHQPHMALSPAESVVMLLPWLGVLLLGLLSKSAWPALAVLITALLSMMHVAFDGAWPAIIGTASPLLALAGLSVVLKWFDAESESRLGQWRWFALPLALGLIALVAVRIARYEDIIITRNHAVFALVTGIVLLVAVMNDSRRWIFALHVLGGWLIGALWWHYWHIENYGEEPQPSFDVTPWILIAALLVRALIRLWYGKRMPRALAEEGPRHRFDEAVFRMFTNVRRKQWEGVPVSVQPTDESRIRFAIFGDVAGSEFPFASRKSGYYAFKQIIKAITARQPDFAVSTGDLATRATPLAYRRLRMLLRHVTFPLLATPGNHDIVNRGAVQSQFFHGLFGSDHGDITVGCVRLILINNAWGSLTDEQWRWVEETFAKSCVSKFTLVFCHKPVFDPREGTFYGMEWRPHAERLHALFVRNRVSAVFSGHIHSLLHDERDGVRYVISGGAGSKLKSANDEHHYLWCEADGERMRITAHAPGAAESLLDLTLEAKS